MQRIKKTEVAWVIDLCRKAADEYKKAAEDQEISGIENGIAALRTEQYSAIADIFQKALDGGDKRIAIG